MRNKILLILIVFMWTGIAEAQRVTGGGLAHKIRIGTSLPSTCQTGYIFMDTDATSGQRLYLCESANTWKLQGDGGGGSVEGTAVLSTGEGGASKFLREDGDGTSSWQIPAGGGDLLANGTVPLTSDWDVGAFDITAVEFKGACIGNASTATALAGDPTDCGANAFANAINASGTLTCATPTLGTDTSGNYVASATATGGLTMTGTEGGSLGITPCTGNEGWIQKWNAATGWTCQADAGGAETNDLEAVATNTASNEVFVGTGAGTGAYIAISACAANEKIEYTDAAPNTFTCETIALTDAEVSDTLTASVIDLEAGTVTNIADKEILIGVGANDASYVAVSGDCTIANTGALTCDHDALDNFVAAEHVDWAGAAAGTIHTDNYVENVVDTLAATLGAGADANDVAITSVGSIAFFDAGLGINGVFDGVLTLDSDGTLALTSDDWSIGVTGIQTGMGNITSDGTIEGATLTEGGAAVSNDNEIEAVVEPLIDTLANLTSVGGQPIAFADAGTDAFFGWDDVGGAQYENLTAAEAMVIIGGAATDLDANGAVAWGNITAGELADNTVDSDDFVHEDWGEVTNASGSVVIDDNVTVTGWTMGASVATTPAENDNDTSLATTAYVQTELGAGVSKSVNLPIYSAKLTGAFTVFTPPTADACTAGAGIDAGLGTWRLLFDATTDECATWQFIMPNNYASSPLLDIMFSMVSGEADEVEWEAAIMCYTPTTDTADIATAGFSNVAVAVKTVSATAGEAYLSTVTLTDDACAAGDIVFIVISTDANDAANDDATGDREVVGVNLRYTGS